MCTQVYPFSFCFALPPTKCKTGKKIASHGRQEPQPAGTAKWPTTLRFGKILGTTFRPENLKSVAMATVVTAYLPKPNQL